MARTCVIYKMYNAWVPFQNILSKMQKKTDEKHRRWLTKRKRRKGENKIASAERKKEIIRYSDATAIRTRLILVKTTNWKPWKFYCSFIKGRFESMSDQIACTKEWKEMPLHSLDRNNLSSPSPFAASERRRRPQCQQFRESRCVVERRDISIVTWFPSD